MIRKDLLKFYRLRIDNEDGTAEITNFMAYDNVAAIQHAKVLYDIVSDHYGCILYKYDNLDTCGPFSRVATIEEPKAIE